MVATYTAGEHAAIDGFLYGRSLGEFMGTPVFTDRNFGTAIDLLTADTQLDDSHSVVLVDASAGAVTLSLPAYTAYMTRMFFRVIKIDSSTNTVTVRQRSTSTDTVNGGTSVAIRRQWGGLDVWCADDSGGSHSGSGSGVYIAVPSGARDLLDFRRLTTALTAYGATDSAITIPATDGAAGWGAAATFAVETTTPASNDLRGRVGVSAGGTPGANPTVTFVYKDGAFPVAPVPMLTRYGTAGLDWAVTAMSTTGFTATAIGTPVDGTTYRFLWALAP